jgi:hypothetical protein
LCPLRRQVNADRPLDVVGLVEVKHQKKIRRVSSLPVAAFGSAVNGICSMSIPSESLNDRSPLIAALGQKKIELSVAAVPCCTMNGPSLAPLLSAAAVKKFFVATGGFSIVSVPLGLGGR